MALAIVLGSQHRRIVHLSWELDAEPVEQKMDTGSPIPAQGGSAELLFEERPFSPPSGEHEFPDTFSPLPGWSPVHLPDVFSPLPGSSPAPFHDPFTPLPAWSPPHDPDAMDLDEVKEFK